jgi:hypothetical protein
VNWTAVLTAAVTGLTAIVVGVLGYFGSRLAALAAARQTEAQTEQRREEREHEEKERRRAAYRAFLAKERSVFSKLHEREPEQPVVRLIEGWMAGLWDDLNAILLISPAPVGAAALDLHDALLEVERAAKAAYTSDAPAEALARFRSAIDPWQRAFGNLLSAMREDVASDQAALPRRDASSEPAE